MQRTQNLKPINGQESYLSNYNGCSKHIKNTSLESSKAKLKQPLPMIGFGRITYRDGQYAGIFTENEKNNFPSPLTMSPKGVTVSTKMNTYDKPSAFPTPSESQMKSTVPIHTGPNFFTTMRTTNNSRQLDSFHTEGEKSDMIKRNTNDDLSRFKAIDLRSSHNIPSIYFSKQRGWNIQNSALRMNQLRQSSNASTMNHNPFEQLKQSPQKKSPKFSKSNNNIITKPIISNPASKKTLIDFDTEKFKKEVQQTKTNQNESNNEACLQQLKKGQSSIFFEHEDMVQNMMKIANKKQVLHEKMHRNCCNQTIEEAANSRNACMGPLPSTERKQTYKKSYMKAKPVEQQFIDQTYAKLEFEDHLRDAEQIIYEEIQEARDRIQKKLDEMSMARNLSSSQSKNKYHPPQLRGVKQLSKLDPLLNEKFFKIEMLKPQKHEKEIENMIEQLALHLGGNQEDIKILKKQLSKRNLNPNSGLKRQLSVQKALSPAVRISCGKVITPIKRGSQSPMFDVRKMAMEHPDDMNLLLQVIQERMDQESSQSSNNSQTFEILNNPDQNNSQHQTPRKFFKLKTKIDSKSIYSELAKMQRQANQDSEIDVLEVKGYNHYKALRSGSLEPYIDRNIKKKRLYLRGKNEMSPQYKKMIENYSGYLSSKWFQSFLIERFGDIALPEACDEVHQQDLERVSNESVVETQSNASDDMPVVLTTISEEKISPKPKRRMTKVLVNKEQLLEKPEKNHSEISDLPHLESQSILHKEHQTFADLIKSVDFDDPAEKRQISSLLKQALMELVLKQKAGFDKEELHKLMHLTQLESHNLMLIGNEDDKQADGKLAKSKMTNDYVAFLTQGMISHQLIFEFSKKMKQALAVDLISKSNLKTSNLMDSLVSEVLQRIRIKDSYLECQINHSNNNPMQKFLAQCIDKQSPALPIFSKIQNKTLILVNYRMNHAMCLAMKEGFRQNPKIIDTLLIDNCGIKDEDLREVLVGCVHLQQIKALQLKRTMLGMESGLAIAKIFEKQFPNQIQELTIANCKMHPSFQQLMFESLVHKNSEIEVLNLINIGMNKTSIQFLVDFLQNENCTFLRELDISYNYLQSFTSYIPLLDALSKCTLPFQVISLAADNLFDESLIAREEAAGNLKGKELLIQQEEVVLECLKRILIKQTSLNHLNLAETGLTDKIIFEISTYIKSSPSLVSVHLSNNPGLTDDSMVRFAEFMEIDDEEIYELPLVVQQNDYTNQELDDVEESAQLTFIADHPVQLSEDPPEEILDTKNKLNIQVRRILKEKSHLINVYKGQPIKRHNKVFNLWRVLGLDHHFQNDSKISSWKLNFKEDARCWVCSRDIYSLLFWNKPIGMMNQLTVHNKKAIMGAIIRNNKRNRDKLSLLFQKVSRIASKPKVFQKHKLKPFDVPRAMIYSELTGWKGLDLFTLSEYCFIIDTKKPPQMKDIDYNHIKNLEFATPEKGAQYDVDCYDQLLYYKNDFDKCRKCIHNSMPFRDPLFINSGFLNMLTMHDTQVPTFVIPQFLRAGKFEYVIEYDKQFYFHSALIHYRQEPLPVQRVGKHQKKSELFYKANSVFSEWRQDTDSTIMKCIDHDLKAIRLPEVFKNKDHVQQVTNFILQQFKNLKHMYLCCLGQSQSVAGIDLPSLKHFFIKTCQLTRVQPKHIDEIFEKVITNFNSYGTYTRNALAPDKLCRKEFIDVFLRVAVTEDPTGILLNVLHEQLKKMMNRIPSVFEWQGFRDEDLWTQECHDIFKTNKENITKVVRKYTKDDKKMVLNWAQVKQIFSVDSELCDEQLLIKAFVFSKQTIIQDFESSKQASQMEVISLEEFMELIARVAHYKAQGTAQETQFLSKKMEQVISSILNLADCKFKKYEEKIDIKYEDSSLHEKRIQATKSPLRPRIVSPQLPHSGPGIYHAPSSSSRRMDEMMGRKIMHEETLTDTNLSISLHPTQD